MSVLNELEPKKVFEFFEYISSVPRGSGNTSKIADLCVDFAKERGLTYYRDRLNNVIIYKDATPGYENCPTVIIQGHIDMVCAKAEDCSKDMRVEPIDLCHDEEYVFANGTTLGGDDGIAVAYAMAVLDSDEIGHPALEVVFTSDEEIGMDGADGIDAEKISGKYLLNIDSEEEGVFTCGCAGGCRVIGRIPVKRRESSELKDIQDHVLLDISLSGLRGGHSGIDIGRQPASAIALMGRILYELSEHTEFCLVDLKGGEFDNVICESSFSRILVDRKETGRIITFIEDYERELKNEYSFSNPDISLMCNIISDTDEAESVALPLDMDSTSKVIKLLFLSFQGVIEMSMELKGMVQTSQNIGMTKLKDDYFNICFLVRSSIDKQKDIAIKKIDALLNLFGGSCELTGNYPGWKYLNDSSLREQCIKSFEKIYGKKPVVNTIHAGLECGIFSEKIEGLDAISFGPNILDIHTPNERLDIASVGRVWRMLIDILDGFGGRK